MKYTAKRSHLLWPALLLTLGALTIQARFGAPPSWTRKTVVPARPAPPARTTKNAEPLVPVQSGGSFNFTQSVIAGGGERSTGGANEITGTIGQSLTTQSSGGTYAVQGGFWPGAVPSQCPTISLLPISVPNGDQSVAYPNQAFTASGGSQPYSFSQTGTLPPGLTFTALTGTLAGTPTMPGTFNFTITATDANQCTGSQNYIVTINCPTITLNPATIPSGTVGVPYTPTQLTATGGTPPHTIQVVNGSLPLGLTLTPSGLLSGTPTQTFNGNITVRASDANQCLGERTFNLTVTCPTVTIHPTNPALQAGAMNVPYTQSFTQSGGIGAIVWSNPGGGLPNGLTLNASTGEVAGTPTAQGSFNFIMRATDANSCFGERQYSLTINAAPCPTITVSPTNSTLTAGTTGTAYVNANLPFTQTGGAGAINWTVSAGTLPNGLSLNAGTGALSGTPITAGAFTFTIRATDANNCTGERQYMLTINSANNGLQFFPLPQPVRLLETRAGLTGCTTPGAIINAGGTFTLPARTTCAGIPADAQAVTGNITVVPSGGGFLTLFPSSAAQPTVANSNFGPGEVTNNVFTVGLGAGDGAFKIFASGTTHVIVDVTGYYAPPAAGGLYFHPLATPVRLLETRAGLNGCIAPGAQLIGTGDPNADPNLDLSVQGRSPVASPCNSIPASAQVLVGNATSVVPDNGGYLTIYPSGGTRPLIASSNYVGSDVINGPFSVKLGADGKFKIYTLRTTHLVVDILGYYSEEAVDANGVGLLFNPLPVPVRLLETRPGGPPLVGCTRTNAPIQGNLNAATHTQQAAGFCGLPASAQAVVGNASVVSTPGAGFLTLFPGNLTNAPLVATSNYPTPAAAGYNRHYFVGLSPVDGTFKILTQFTTELILDASGYFAP